MALVKRTASKRSPGLTPLKKSKHAIPTNRKQRRATLQPRLIGRMAFPRFSENAPISNTREARFINHYRNIAAQRRIPITTFGEVLRKLGNTPQEAEAAFMIWAKIRYGKTRIPIELMQAGAKKFLREEYGFRPARPLLRRP